MCEYVYLKRLRRRSLAVRAVVPVWTRVRLLAVQKQNLTIDATDILFVRFICLKTSEEQELPLFPDLDFVTCPVYAIALALITQTAP
ncbi:hypothetical protein PC110_g11222 [Phytophthora cactorum]|uniref:Uncharacterized protein n=1 Tax=Phytophthora cactorum TaxID=29920 RepID=A0A329S6Z3_9STRA|nr:hypothetical protein PC110_g11222 [Phytophthora cactorum]